MRMIFSCFIVLLSLGQTTFADGPLTDSSTVRFGLFAEYDGNLNDRFGIRLRLNNDDIVFGQFSFYTSAFNNNGQSLSSSTEDNTNQYYVVLGYERRVVTYLMIDCNVIGAFKYDWSRTLLTEAVYSYPTGASRIFERFAGTENKTTSYQFILGIGAEYHVTEQLSLELVKQFHYEQEFRYSTDATAAPSSTRIVRAGFEDVFINVIYYF